MSTFKTFSNFLLWGDQEKMKRVKDDESTLAMNMTGDSIRSARLAMGLTQKQLSERLETMAVYIYRGSVLYI